MAAKLAIRLVRSPIGRPARQKMTVSTLGLRRMGHIVVQNDTPQIRGMVRRVRHLVQVEEIPEEGEAGGQ